MHQHLVTWWKMEPSILKLDLVLYYGIHGKSNWVGIDVVESTRQRVIQNTPDTIIVKEVVVELHKLSQIERVIDSVSLRKDIRNIYREFGTNSRTGSKNCCIRTV
jgi:hypothetical protein